MGVDERTIAEELAGLLRERIKSREWTDVQLDVLWDVVNDEVDDVFLAVDRDRNG